MSSKTQLKQTEFGVEQEPHYIVGIGASAGGLEALQAFLTSLPTNTGFSYIIVQHLAPDYKSLLDEILGKYTEMPVCQVIDGMEVEPDCVYIIQPGKIMEISEGRIHLRAQVEKQLNLPIDIFFRSLAEDAGANAIAIILSGTGSDGTNGIKAIKEHYGMVLVQDLESCKFDGMPRSAIRTGLADAQLTPEKIAYELFHISEAVGRYPSRFLKSEKQIDADLMKKIYTILKKVSDVNFTHYKQSTILRRIERRMMLAHIDSLEAYVQYLYEMPEEAKILSKEVLIGVTSFFRDPEFFEILQKQVIQKLVMRSTNEEPIRIWVTGCSTGEEAYSIAILLCETMEQLKLHKNIKIFATDLDKDAIVAAGKGIYGNNIIDTVSSARLSKLFTRKNDTYIVNHEIRQMIVFSRHNVFQDPPFGHLDLISCRNMLIYFQPVLQNNLFGLFHMALKDGGYLFLGKSEAIGSYTDAFPVVDSFAKIFTHKREIKISNQRPLSYLQTKFMEDEYDEEQDGDWKTRRDIMTEVADRQKEEINLILLEQFMPACLVIDEKNNIHHIYGESSNYVHMPVGKFTSNVFNLITDALKAPASTILKEAREKKDKVQYSDISFSGERENAKITLTAMPISKLEREKEGFYALIFSEQSNRGDFSKAVVYDMEHVTAQRIIDLEQELGDVQGKLNKSVAEQECVNEELQAANEELLTANEELQSSNEELQSVNEELYTVNSEYQLKMTELVNLNDDIANFLSSTLIGIIFVDNKLNIRRYTDYVTKEFSVMDHDIGRSLQFISYYFPTVDITKICAEVIKTLIPDEREITTNKNKVFFMRVAPYRSTENKILGCVITLVDVTGQKKGEKQLENTEMKLYEANEQIERKSDDMSRIVHEIRTPMSQLIGLMKMTLEQKEVPESILKSLEDMNETVEYMSSIVTNITMASRVERGVAEQVYEPFRLRTTLENIETMMQVRTRMAGLEFEISLEDDYDPVYLGNETSLEQILVNFINNAIKYTQHGAVGLKVYEDKTKVDDDGLIPVYFIVSDTGIGIEKGFISEMFKPFTRAAKDDANEKISLGLGLSIAKNLLNAMGGKVSVESEVGEGSVFTICIPFYYDNEQGNKAAFERDINGGKVKLKGSHILVAEDNALNRRILCKLLDKEEITYDEAVNGEAAVDAFIKNPSGTYDYILMDMRMPILDGIGATDKIRESNKKDAQKVPIIGVSANGFAEDIKRAKEAGMDGYTTKPIDRNHLFSIMKSLKNKNK